MTEIEFNEWVLANGKDILRFCRMTTANMTEGDELYQDTMLKLWEQHEKLNTEQNIKSYALSVSIYLWKNQKKRFARRKKLAPTESYEWRLENGLDISQEENSDTNPEAKIIQNEILTTVRNMVQELPEKYRTILYLYYSANMKIKDIASLMKVPENTIKSRMRKGKEILRTKLEVAGYDR